MDTRKLVLAHLTCFGCGMNWLFSSYLENSNLFQGGMYVLQLMDTYSPSYGLLFTGICETIALGWVYGKSYIFINHEAG